MKKTISTDQTPANIDKVMEILFESPLKLETLSGLLKGGQFAQPLGQGERSFVENAAHLIHCEIRSSGSIYLALLENEPLVPDLHPERDLGKLLRFDLLSHSELITYFSIRRKVLLSTLANLDENGWGRSIREEGKKRKESIYWLARSMALHETEHLDELENKIRGLKD
jgi:hypothetical protein